MLDTRIVFFQQCESTHIDSVHDSKTIFGPHEMATSECQTGECKQYTLREWHISRARAIFFYLALRMTVFRDLNFDHCLGAKKDYAQLGPSDGLH